MQRLITVSYNSPGHGPEGWAGFMSQRKVQLTPGRTWQTLVLGCKAEEASVGSYLQCRAGQGTFIPYS